MWHVSVLRNAPSKLCSKSWLMVVMLKLIKADEELQDDAIISLPTRNYRRDKLTIKIKDGVSAAFTGYVIPFFDFRVNCGASFEVWWWLSIEFYLCYCKSDQGDANGYDLVVVDAHKSREGENEASVCLCRSQDCYGSYLNLIRKEPFRRKRRLHLKGFILKKQCPMPRKEKDQLLRNCCITWLLMEDGMLNIQGLICSHNTSGSDDVYRMLRKSLLWLRDELRNL
ncbi:hypothetical protein DCAR_0414857 [Daucus carota subsp. sativus]|uniref:ATXR3 C-terminal domain-containing protein n=1 Tax=Daucus carota subsp. sativus TaxID=79200 RepID=A0A165A2B4_DAUCS|nr:hypothetical protein DCAR_0414857 [Daucus carota subsp. sativus]